VAERELREAATANLDDWFNFELGPSRPIRDGIDARRIPIEALIGPTVWVSFRVDLVGAGLKMTGEPDEVPALARVGMPSAATTAVASRPLPAVRRCFRAASDDRGALPILNVYKYKLDCFCETEQPVGVGRRRNGSSHGRGADRNRRHNPR